MTLAVIIAALIWGGFYVSDHATSYVSGPLTVYVIIFVAGLAAASVAAVISRARPNIMAALVLIAAYGGAHFAWSTTNPVLWNAVVWIATAAYFILVGRERWEWGIGAACLLGLAFAALTAMGVIPGPMDRPPVYLAWNFADLSSLIGHVASVLLGLGSGDWGRRVRTTALVPVR